MSGTASASGSVGLAPEPDGGAAAAIADVVQGLLLMTIDLHLTLAHVRWNAIGTTAAAVQQVMEPQVRAVRQFSDELAERVVALGGSPVGTAGAVVAGRTTPDHGVRNEDDGVHVLALDAAFVTAIEDYRRGIGQVDEFDPATEDLFLARVQQLELFHWIVRTQIEDASVDDIGTGR